MYFARPHMRQKPHESRIARIRIENCCDSNPKERLDHRTLTSRPGSPTRDSVRSLLPSSHTDERPTEPLIPTGRGSCRQSADKCQTREIVFPFCPERWYKNGDEAVTASRL